MEIFINTDQFLNFMFTVCSGGESPKHAPFDLGQLAEVEMDEFAPTESGTYNPLVGRCLSKWTNFCTLCVLYAPLLKGLNIHVDIGKLAKVEMCDSARLQKGFYSTPRSRFSTIRTTFNI